MKLKKFFALMLLFGFAAGFAFAEGGGEDKTAAMEGPQYGGTLTYSFWEWREPTNWDVTTGSWTNTSRFLYPMYSFLVIGDTETYGPRGTNQYAFQAHQEVPDEYLKGDLAESWEVKATGLTFNLKKGIMYTGNKRIGMPSREFVAEDAVFGLKHILEGPLGKGISAFVKDIYAPDKYTVKVDFNYYEFTWGAMLIYGMGSLMYPEEVIKAGAENWRNHSGTGAWIIENYTSGAGATYVRNPDYFGTTTIDGVVYETPFADKLVKPIIPDKLSLVSALRTGKLDVAQIDSQYVDSLASTSPELIVSEYANGGMEVLHPDCADPPFNNRDVRRAMMIGLDFQSYIDTVLLGKGVVNSFPAPGSPYWTPIEEMPESTAVLFSGDKELAKKMLADAGYPNGFTVKGYFKPSSAMNANQATWTESALKEIGITVELVGLEAAVHEALRFSRDFDGIYFRSDANGGATELPQRKTECASLASSWNNAEFDAMLDKAQKMVDSGPRTQLLKEAALLFTDDVGNISYPAGMNYKFWWPWVNNYYGEEELGYGNQQPCIDTIWLDLSKKKEMGF